MLKTALSSAAGATQTATDVPAAGRVTFEIAVLLAVHLAIALAATVAVQSFAMF
jgi:hypothetical protein